MVVISGVLEFAHGFIIFIIYPSKGQPLDMFSGLKGYITFEE